VLRLHRSRAWKGGKFDLLSKEERKNKLEKEGGTLLRSEMKEGGGEIGRIVESREKRERGKNPMLTRRSSRERKKRRKKGSSNRRKGETLS